MNRYLFLPMVLVGLSASALACLNDYTPNVAAIQRSRTVLEQIQKHVVKEPWEVRRDRLRKELVRHGDYWVKNDLANALAHTGESAEAVTLLEQIEAEKPGLYVTASNLGTAYELAGEDQKALEWIRKGSSEMPVRTRGPNGCTCGFWRRNSPCEAIQNGSSRISSSTVA